MSREQVLPLRHPKNSNKQHEIDIPLASLVPGGSKKVDANRGNTFGTGSSPTRSGSRVASPPKTGNKSENDLALSVRSNAVHLVAGKKPLKIALLPNVVSHLYKRARAVQVAKRSPGKRESRPRPQYQCSTHDIIFFYYREHNHLANSPIHNGTAELEASTHICRGIPSSLKETVSPYHSAANLSGVFDSVFQTRYTHRLSRYPS